MDTTKKFIAAFAFAVLSFSALGVGSPKAIKGGTFKYNLGQAPTTLNPLSSTDAYASSVQSYIIESLADRNPDTYEWQPLLAKSWEVSKDGTEYTFTLRDGVKWHDGKPLTIEDVKFSFDAIVDPTNKYKTAQIKPYYENIASAEVIGKNKIKFTAKKKYFGNFDVVAGLSIVPKHIYENPTEKQQKKLNKTLIGTGPYTLDGYRRGKHITLLNNKSWWGAKDPARKFEHNYGRILMRFVKDGTVAIQRLQKGDLDFNGLTVEEFERKTNGPQWGKSVFKVKTQNKAPTGYGFIGWNLKDRIFKSKKVRVALYHLLDREKMIEKFRFGMSLPATGPLYRQSIYANEKVKPVLYDPKKALKLLREDGWADTDKDGILDKVIDGQKVNLSFTILEPNQEFVKYLTIYKEDAKKAGVDINVKFVEWNTFIKKLDERSFEAVRLAWSGGSINWDPKQIWHSSSASASGSNFISYSNPKVDKLIDEARVTLDKEKRIVLLKEVYKQIAEDVPYAFFFNEKYRFYGHTDRLKREKDTYQFDLGLSYWWLKK
ncbi:peptide ABC transporter substrate-binding protein [Halobacteriovorax marinus]|uniref:ABC transport system, substrate-binding lipoprotein n=1 Tax=Halobacteriovorax marinus (strain ATCC BAA-682 / DSM 15412 / SJ) TaxID=862908 RepID=E1X3D0_HALMS|nr:ABC transporter substrate-binding protein [Halobacteriovorax marinus]ATH06656.1 peptide ABC transporter substrate-binding protein [Halobacteriovorax marinus]CBW25225.1 ABC transport system, substrate-binding lipoprotein [Halobacteriovorax marinus SJ]